MMHTTLEIVIALATSLLVSGVLVGGSVVAIAVVSAGGVWLMWRLLRKRR